MVRRDEIGSLWAALSIDSEWGRLRSVIEDRPGAELDVSLSDPDAVQMLAQVDLGKARAQHDVVVEAYFAEGVAVHQAVPEGTPTPNQMFCADLVFLTPEGAPGPPDLDRAGWRGAVDRPPARGYRRADHPYPTWERHFRGSRRHVAGSGHGDGQQRHAHQLRGDPADRRHAALDGG